MEKEDICFLCNIDTKVNDSKKYRESLYLLKGNEENFFVDFMFEKWFQSNFTLTTD